VWRSFAKGYYIGNNCRMKRLYVDTAALTPTDMRVTRVVERLIQEAGANSGSIHTEGQQAYTALDEARHRVAAFCGVKSYEVVFTSGGTESNNLALRGVVEALPRYGGHIITSALEHASVLAPSEELERRGCTRTIVGPNGEGLLSVDHILAAVRPDTVLVSLHLANNEIGVIQPIRDIARVLRAYRQEKGSVYPYIHTDACQAPRFMPLFLETLGVDLMSMSGAKVYGPQGVGALIVRAGTNCAPLLFGGGQEHGLRSGTPDVPAIGGFAEALSICEEERASESELLSELRDALIKKLSVLDGVVINGSTRYRLPNNVHVSFRGITGERMVIELDRRGVAAATGSACSSRTKSASHVLLALAPRDHWRRDGAVRFTLGRGATHRDVEFIATQVSAILSTCTLSHN